MNTSRIHPLTIGASLLVLLGGASGCSGDDAGAQPPTTIAGRSTIAPTSAPPSSDASPATTTGSVPVRRPCPNAYGGMCRGALDAGEYTTLAFQPTLTYTVPDGWSNLEDLVGNFLLLPPGGSLGGVDAATSDYIGVYTSVRAPLGCDERADPSVEPTVDAYVRWLQGNLHLVVGEPRPVTIDGMTGVEVDVRGAGPPPCTDTVEGVVFNPVLVGQSPSSLHHTVDTDYSIRLNLFDRDDRAILAIEIADAPNGGSDFEDWPTAAADINQTFDFEP